MTTSTLGGGKKRKVDENDVDEDGHVVEQPKAAKRLQSWRKYSQIVTLKLSCYRLRIADMPVCPDRPETETS